MLAAIHPGRGPALRRRPAAARLRAVLEHRPALRHRRRHGGPARPAGLPGPPQGQGAGAGGGKRSTPITANQNRSEYCTNDFNDPLGQAVAPGRRPAGTCEASEGQEGRRGPGRLRPRSWTTPPGWPRCRWSRTTGPSGGRSSCRWSPRRSAAPSATRRLPSSGATGGRRPRGLRGVVRPPAQAAQGGNGVHDRGGHGGGQLGHPPQPALGPRASTWVLPPAGAGAPVEPGAAGEEDTPPPRPAWLPAPATPEPEAARHALGRPARPGDGACSTAPSPGTWRSSTSPRRSTPPSGRNGRPAGARWNPFCCAGPGRRDRSTRRPCPGSAAPSWHKPASELGQLYVGLRLREPSSA